MIPWTLTKAHWPAALAASACAALGLVWVVQPAIAPFWGARLVLFLVGALGCAGLALLVWRKEHSASEDAARFFQVLNRLDARGGLPGALLEALPQLEADHPWRSSFDKLRDCFDVMSERLAAAEHARAGAEVRARRLAAQREQLEDILAGLADPVIAVDQFGEIVLANATAQQVFGLEVSDAEHPALDRLSHCEELVALLQETRRRKSATQRTGELTIEQGDDAQHCYRIACRPLVPRHDAAADRGATHGAVAVLTDISSLKGIQRRNAEFVSAASHEMKTPLASIKAYLELLEDGDAADETERDEFFRIIRSQTDRLQRLIENLLNLARIEAGVVKVEKKARSLNELLEEAFHIVAPTAEQKGIKLTVDLSPLYLGVLADHDTLLQAAINLICNAVKYTPAGGSVVVRSRLTDQEVIFEVEDTGVGLSPEDCRRVFERFYRVPKDSEMAPGTGLGLALVKHIVEDIHAGRIEVESEPGQGSTFRVILPGVKQVSS